MTGKLTTELWRKIDPILDRALELPAEQRGAYVEEACAGDPQLRAALQRMLAADAGVAAGFLESLSDVAGEISAEPSPLPETIAGYTVLRLLGEGGMGVVYLARQTVPLRRLVAVKVLKLGMDTAQVVARFEAERQALAIMDHPSIATVFDAGATEDGRPYFVMEYVDGVPITEYCDEKRLATAARLELLASVCDAIQHAHHKGVIHRDIKPSNVLIGEADGGPVAKVIDFGIAKAIEQRLTEQTLFTVHGQLVGTPAYMSPEQAEPSGLDVDTRTDVYSLGVLLYELLTGALPFDAEELRRAGLAEIQRIIRETDPPRPSTRLRTLPGSAMADIATRRGTDGRTLARQIGGELDWVVMRAIEKDRDRRYETPNELALDLRRFMSHEPVAARPASTAYRFGKFVRRHRAGVAAAVVVLIVTIVGVSGLAWGLIEARRQRDEAERQAAIAQAVNDFLNLDLLEGVDPERGGSRQVTMLEVVERAAERIDEGRFAEQPEVEGAVRSTLARTFTGLGEYEPAGTQWSRVVELFESVYGRESSEAISARLDLGGNYARRALYEEAERLFGEVLADARETLGPEATMTLTTMNNLAFVRDHLGRYDESLPVHERLLEIRMRKFGEADENTLISMSNLGYVYYVLGRIDEAETLFRRRAELCPEVFGPTHPETMNSVNSLAAIYMRRDEFEKAERVVHSALEEARPVLGDRHPITLVLLHTLGVSHNGQSEFDEAEATLAAALEGRTATLGPEHPGTLGTAFMYASVICKRGRGEEAVELFDETLAAFRRIAPDGDAKTAEALSHHGSCLAGLARYERAESRLLEGYEMHVEITGGKSERIDEHVDRLVELYEAWGRPDRAENWRGKRTSAKP